MTDSPIKYSIFSLSVYCCVMLKFGFSSAMVLMIIFSSIIILCNLKKYGTNISFSLALLYLVLFDSEVFTFTRFNLRVWYMIILFFIIKSIVLFAKNPTIIFKDKLNSLAIFVLFILSLVSFIFDSAYGRLSIIKYWIFSVGLLFFLVKYLKPFFLKNKVIFLNFLLYLNLFVVGFGLLQFAFIKLGIGSKFMLHFYNIRPEAFFSETTWYGTYAVFGIILIFLKYNTSSSNYVLFLLPFNLMGMLLSATRNAYFMIISFVVVSIILFLFFRDKINAKKLFNKYLIALLFLCIVIFFLKHDLIMSYVAYIQSKFQMKDISATNRIEAVKISLNKIQESLYTGNGFDFNPLTEITDSGASLGSKSFNLFLMILHIFGLSGFIPFILMLAKFFIKSLINFFKTKDIYLKYSLIIFTGFFLMASVAPLHQFPMGISLLVVAIIFASDSGHSYSVIN